MQILFISGGQCDIFLKSELQKTINYFKLRESEVSLDNVQIFSIYLQVNDESENVSTVFQEAVKWNSVENRELEKDKTSPELIKEETHLGDLYKLAEYLHSFVDENCSNTGAEEPLHILWCVNSYIPCPSEAVELYGVFERLILWHNADVRVIATNVDAIGDWISFLPLRVVSSCSDVMDEISTTLWSGSLSFSCGGKNNTTYSLPKVFLQSSLNEEGEHVLCNIFQSSYVLPTAEVFSDVDISSVASTFIKKSSLCFLSPSSCLRPDEKEEVLNVLNDLTSKLGVGILFRIRFSNIPPSLPNGDSTSTDCWKQKIAEGNFNLSPQLFFEGYHENLVFLLLPSCTRKEKFECLALQDPCTYGDAVVQLVQEQFSAKVEDCDEQKSKIFSMMADSPVFTQLQETVLQCLLLRYSTELKKGFAKKNIDIKSWSSKEKCLIEHYSCQEIMSILSKMKSKTVNVRTPDRVLLAEVERPKEAWPEYQALMQREKNKNIITRIDSADFLHGFAPPVSCHRSDNVDLEFILSNLNQESLSLSKLQNGNVCVSKGYDWLRKLTWRESLVTKFHGIYFNNGEGSEKLERSINLLRQQVVKNCTASTCTLFQSKTSISRSKSSRLDAEISTEHSSKLSLKRPPQKRLFGDWDNCSVSSSIRNSTLRSCKVVQRAKSNAKNDVKRNETSGKNLTASQILHSANIQGASSKRRQLPTQPRSTSTGLSEIHKQKLRNAVVCSLEGEGISMKHSLFKLCFKKLFTVCKPFALDVAGLGSTTKSFEKIAKDHVKQVIDFEKQKQRSR